ncbi:MAG TPA: molybdopterin molybdotransferase MoeA [Nitrososphaerales archaeon]|nr:molybdopterin molybdotransferase MoeA [Nitrososphaerales archaeon]
MQGERRYTSLEDALLALARALGPRSSSESVDVREGYGRVLSRDVVAREDSPRRDSSHFDGFAVVSADTLGATGDSPTTLTLKRGAGSLGALPKGRLARGEAVKVLTGGFLPAGADAVVPLEDVSAQAGGVEVSRPVQAGEHVFPAGADVKKGERILQAGRTLMGQDLVLLASLRFERFVAFKRPRVAILPTGSELTADVGDKRPGKVVESHSLMLEQLVEEAGGRASTLPIVPDERRALARALGGALKSNDVVFTLAGSSVGEPDLVESVIRGFGRATTALVHGIKVNRGRVMGFAVVSGRPVVILPGPIQGALNAFIVLGYPLIRYHLGMGWEQPPAVAATMGADWDATGKFKDFDQIVYLRLTKDPASPDGLVAVPSSGETEKVSFLVSKNAYALLSGNNPRLAKGDRVQARLLPGFSRLE